MTGLRLDHCLYFSFRQINKNLPQLEHLHISDQQFSNEEQMNSKRTFKNFTYRNVKRI